MMIRKIAQKIEQRSDAANAAIAAAKAAAAEYGLRKLLDDGTPRCVFGVNGDECVVSIVNVYAYDSEFRSQGFAYDRNIGGFTFPASRLADAAAIVNGGAQ